MQNWRAVVLTAIMLCSSASWAASTIKVRQPEIIPSGKALTLTDAINLALKNQPSVRVAAAQMEVQKGLVSQARSGLLPDTLVTGSTSLADSGHNSGNSTLTASGSQLIYDFGRSRWQLTQAERQQSASISAFGTAKSDVVLNVKQSYYNLLQTTRLVQVFQENLKAQEGHVTQAQVRLDVGVAPRSDVLKAAAAAASAQVDLVSAKNSDDLARVDLNTAMGIDVRSAAEVQDTAESETPVMGLDEAMDLAMKNRPEVSEAEDQVLAAEASVKAAETGNLPAFTTSVSDSKDFGGQVGSSNSWAWLLNMQWHPFDSGLTRGAVIQARAALVQVQESLYTIRQSVSRDVVAARLNILAAQESLTAATSEVTSAKENLDASNGRYEAGVGIFLDVIDAQAAYLKAQVDEAVARYGLSTTRAQLEHAIGATAVEGTYK